jgi:hypothetical protein
VGFPRWLIRIVQAVSLSLLLSLTLLGLRGVRAAADPASIALDVHLEIRRMMHQAIDRGERHGGIWEDARPFAEWMISHHDQAAPFVSSNNQLPVRCRI